MHASSSWVAPSLVVSGSTETRVAIVQGPDPGRICDSARWIKWRVVMTTFAAAGPGSMRPGTGQPAWREVLAAYARPRLGRSLLDLATSVLPYLALSVRDVPRAAGLVPARARARGPDGRFLRARRSSSSTTARTARSCAPNARTPGWASSLGCSSSRRSCAGDTTTRSITRPSGDLDRRGAGDVRTLTVRRVPERCRGGAASATGCFATRS